MSVSIYFRLTLKYMVEVISGYKRIISVDTSLMNINVQQGDFFGFFNHQLTNVFTYDRCTTDGDREIHDGYMTTKFIFNGHVKVGNDYSFGAVSPSESCRIHSIKFCIM